MLIISCKQYVVSTSIYVLFLIIDEMQMPRILYVQFWCTDPDWDGTTTEQTDIHLHP